MHVSERLPGETSRDYAYRVIKESIIMLDLEPGSKISENIIAAELGLSRTPVREALIELSKTKIIDIYPQRGSYISKIDYSMVEESRFLRLVLEKAIVELDCEIDERPQLKTLQDNVNLQKYYLQESNPEQLLKLDNEFHELLFIMANKQQTYYLIESMMTHFDRLRSLSLKTVKDNKTVGDHEMILEALIQRDKESVISIMEKHLTRHHFEQAELRSRYEQYFK